MTRAIEIILSIVALLVVANGGVFFLLHAQASGSALSFALGALLIGADLLWLLPYVAEQTWNQGDEAQ
jgi:hypothetical protein